VAKYALLIGGDRYAQPPHAGRTPAMADLRRLRGLLADPGIGAFDDVELLINPDRRRFAGAVEALASTRAGADLLLLVVSGVAAVEDAGDVWLLAADATLPVVPARALSAGALTSLLDLGASRCQLLSLDCLTPGAHGPPLPGPLTGLGGRIAGRLAAPWRAVRSACAPLYAEPGEGPDGLGTPQWTLVEVLADRLSGGDPPHRVLEETFALPPGRLLEYWRDRQARRARPEGFAAAVTVSQMQEGPRAHRQRPASAAPWGSRRGRRRRWPLLRRRRAKRTPYGYSADAAPRPRGADRAIPWAATVLALTLLAATLFESVDDWSTTSIRVSVANRVHSLVPVAGRGLRARPSPSTFRDVLLDGGKGPEMVALPGGYFVMGSPPREPERFASEGPERLVRVEAFALGAGEVSFAEYDRFALATGRPLPDDAGWGRGARPVINVSWHDAVAYARWLSEETRQHYRLPSEAEWEMAARAGSNTAFSTGNCISTESANYNGAYDYNRCGARTGIERRQTLRMRALPPNRWGLYHMSGNVWEWTQDCWHANYAGAPSDGLPWLAADAGVCERRVIRGGGWRFEPGYLRSASRIWADSGDAGYDIGFRVARCL
jgi:formylglycine-generating enzyme required for sulfatase activity